MIKRPPSPSRLIWESEWLNTFCTYDQKRAILRWAYQHGDLKPFRIDIEEAEEIQNSVTLHFKGGKMKF
jgi:hypothetical protein